MPTAAVWLEEKMGTHPLKTARSRFFDGREANVSWYPEELSPRDPDTLPPQKRAEHEIESNTQELLYLIHVTTQPLDEFVSSMVGTATPFMSAGSIAYGAL
jgi:hypothetical protein